jgi:hypothetical protein
MENVDILEYFTGIWNRLVHTFSANLVHFSRFGTYRVPRKIWQPLPQQ